MQFRISTVHKRGQIRLLIYVFQVHGDSSSPSEVGQREEESLLDEAREREKTICAVGPVR